MTLLLTPSLVQDIAIYQESGRGNNIEDERGRASPPATLLYKSSLRTSNGV